MIEIKDKKSLDALLKKYKCYATDYDGTIIDSMPMWEAFASAYVKSKGVEPKDDIDKKIKYLSNYDAAKIIFDDYHILSSVDEVYDDINNFVTDVYPKIGFKKGSYEMLLMLDKNGRNLLSSATPEHLLRLSAESLNILSHYKKIYSSSDTKKSKESGDLFRYILDNENISSSELLVIEDSILAMKVCKKMGIDTLIIRDFSNENNMDEIEEYATYYVDLNNI